MPNQLALTEIGYAFTFGTLVFVDAVVVVVAIFALLGNIRAQLEEKLREETVTLQDEFETRIRKITELQIEGLSEITQL